MKIPSPWGREYLSSALSHIWASCPDNPPPHHAPEQGLETQPQAQKAPRPPDSLNHYASDNEEAQCSATPLDGKQAGRAVTAPQSVS